jgi:[FeFe] hydrogenase H-cluster maturation GTPase HydF
MQEQLLDGLIEDGSLVLLVMPQDIQAPKGRLILPQVQTIRELLDRRCTVVSTTADGYETALDRLNCPPDLIITDSQCFSQVYEKKPDTSALTSFSILMAAAKGDLSVFIDGVSAIDQARGTFRVLIAEACTHVPLQEDIGTIKIPMLLRKQFGDQVEITNVRGNDFPSIDELKQYDLIIHCGACMFNRRHVLSRIAAAQEAGVPITNYGIFLAFAAGILDKIQF